MVAQIRKFVLLLVVSISLSATFLTDVDSSDFKRQRSTNIIGDWQLQDTQTTGSFFRQSGHNGDIIFFLAPLNDDKQLNGRFFLTCTRNAFFFDVNIPIDVLHQVLLESQIKISLDGRDIIQTIGFGSSILIENGMVKVEIDPKFLDEYFIGRNVSVGIQIGSRHFNYDYGTIKGRTAVGKFLSWCYSKKKAAL